MKAIVVAALLALSFTTGFTCSKNQPETTTETTTVESTEVTPVDGAPADAPAATETPAGEAAQ